MGTSKIFSIKILTFKSFFFPSSTLYVKSETKCLSYRWSFSNEKKMFVSRQIPVDISQIVCVALSLIYNMDPDSSTLTVYGYSASIISNSKFNTSLWLWISKNDTPILYFTETTEYRLARDIDISSAYSQLFFISPHKCTLHTVYYGGKRRGELFPTLYLVMELCHRPKTLLLKNVSLKMILIRHQAQVDKCNTYLQVLYLTLNASGNGYCLIRW